MILQFTFFADLKCHASEICILFLESCHHVENISDENSYLTTVTKTSQILSSGMLKLGGKLDRKSSPVGNTITLKTGGNVLFTKLWFFFLFYLTESGTGLSTFIWLISLSFSVQSRGRVSLNFPEYSLSIWWDQTPFDLSPKKTKQHKYIVAKLS